MPIVVSDFFNELSFLGVDFFTGVPDSLLKDFCAYLDDHASKSQHVIAANEGNALALAAGYYLATQKIPLMYMQNSGLGNAVNPLLSLCDPEIYSLPSIILMGWRGEPGIKDAIQHVKDGRIQEQFLKILETPYIILSKGDLDWKEKVTRAYKCAKQEKRPYILLAKKGLFGSYSLSNKEQNNYNLTREQALKCITRTVKDGLFVSTTGKLSRELFEVRKNNNQKHTDFLTIGSMGHASSIALGCAIGAPSKQVVCLDGDGALLMHMGALAVVGQQAPNNFLHFVLNNGAHQSVGSQKTAGFTVDIPLVAQACGYRYVKTVSSQSDLEQALIEIDRSSGPKLIEVRINTKSRDDLGRPDIGLEQIKKCFMDNFGAE